MDVTANIKDILSVEIFVEVPVAEMDEDDSLRDVFGLDSLGFVELRAQAESRFGVKIPESEFTPANFVSIRTVAAMVQRLLDPSAPAGVAANADTV